MGNGTVHDYNDLPIVTAGRLGGAISTGKHYMFDDKVPVANLWLTQAEIAGVEREHSPTALAGLIFCSEPST